jgi:hypothetical protein
LKKYFIYFVLITKEIPSVADSKSEGENTAAGSRKEPARKTAGASKKSCQGSTDAA